MQASERHGFEGDGFSYLKSPLWWAGIVTRTWIPRSPFRSQADKMPGSGSG